MQIGQIVKFGDIRDTTTVFLSVRGVIEVASGLGFVRTGLANNIAKLYRMLGQSGWKMDPSDVTSSFSDKEPVLIIGKVWK